MNKNVHSSQISISFHFTTMHYYVLVHHIKSPVNYIRDYNPDMIYILVQGPVRDGKWTLSGAHPKLNHSKQ